MNAQLNPSSEPQRRDEHRGKTVCASGGRLRIVDKAAGQSLFFSALQLCKILSRCEVFSAALAASRRPRICRQRFALRPGGTPQEINRGQARAAGAAPGCAAELTMPQRGIEEVFGGGFLPAFPPPLVASGHFLRCPAGARRHSARFPGAASAGADLPPANLRRRPSGTGTGRPCTHHGKTPARGCRFPSRLFAASLLCVHRVSVVHLLHPNGLVTTQP